MTNRMGTSTSVFLDHACTILRLWQSVSCITSSMRWCIFKLISNYQRCGPDPDYVIWPIPWRKGRYFVCQGSMTWPEVRVRMWSERRQRKDWFVDTRAEFCCIVDDASSWSICLGCWWATGVGQWIFLHHFEYYMLNYWIHDAPEKLDNQAFN